MQHQSPDDSILTWPILIGDVGGTNARFAILLDSYAEPREFPDVKVANFATIDEAIQTAILDHTSVQPRSAILAVAGVVEGDEIELTNCHWVVRPKAMAATLGLEDILVLNDFEAQALSIVALEEDQMEKIGGGAAEPEGNRVVLGPGTGLGVAGLIHACHRWIPVAGEGGHMDIGPRSARDFEVFPYLEPIEGRISGEQLLCGRGLVNIHAAVARASGKVLAPATPAEITAAALAGTDPVAQEALFMFVTCLGRTAGDLALVFMSRGGVYLTGGIAQKIVPALRGRTFRDAFEDKAPHRHLLEAMPVYVITNPRGALAGLAAYARTPTRFGVKTAGRRWRALPKRR